MVLSTPSVVRRLNGNIQISEIRISPFDYSNNAQRMLMRRPASRNRLGCPANVIITLLSILQFFRRQIINIIALRRSITLRRFNLQLYVYKKLLINANYIQIKSISFCFLIFKTSIIVTFYCYRLRACNSYVHIIVNYTCYTLHV